MADDLAHDAALDDDVRLAAQPLEDAVEDVAGVDDEALGRLAGPPRELDRNGLRSAAVRQDAPQSVRRLIHDVARVAFPAGRLGLVFRERRGRRGWTAFAVDVQRPQ